MKALTLLVASPASLLVGNASLAQTGNAPNGTGAVSATTTGSFNKRVMASGWLRLARTFVDNSR